MKSVTHAAMNALEGAGFGRPPFPRQFDEADRATASFTVDPLVFRFVRDRGEDFVDVAPASQPSRFAQFDDVAIALGLRTIDQVLARTAPEPLAEVLRLAKENWSLIESAFSGDRLAETLRDIERATASRAFILQARMS